MANVIKIKKGLDINLKGKAPEVLVQANEDEVYGISPAHYPGFVPKLAVKVGDRVKAGTPVLFHKSHPELKIVSPVSGEVVEVQRGEKRRLLNIEIKADKGATEYEDFSVSGVEKMTGEQIKELLLSSGFFALIRQRPYDYIANPDVSPRDIFVTAQYTAPLAPSAKYLVGEEIQYLQTAVTALGKLTTGKVYVGMSPDWTLQLKGCELYTVEGPHPAGNVGVLVNHTKPVNKGETVWTLSVAELLLIGRFLSTGKADFTKTIALAGSRLATRGFARVMVGSRVETLVSDKYDSSTETRRVIDGDVLTGTQVKGDYKYLSPFSNIVTVIPEGDDVHEMFGWAVPGFNKFSMGHTYPSFLLGKKKEYDIDARIRGGKRAMIMSNEYDKVFPFDILPEYLLKAIITFDIDKMENLGIYEVAPEDFALCEFVDTSKIELQYIVRKGLDELYKEVN